MFIDYTNAKTYLDIAKRLSHRTCGLHALEGLPCPYHFVTIVRVGTRIAEIPVIMRGEDSDLLGTPAQRRGRV